MDYIYTKYPVNYNQLVDEILGVTATGLTSGLGLLMDKISINDMMDGSISYSDASFNNNLTITTNIDLTTDQHNTLDYIVSNHIANPNYCVLDWARRRDILSSLFYAKAGMQLQNFAGLSTRDKMIGCVYFFIPYSIRIQMISDSQDQQNWTWLLTKTKESREACVEAMRIKVGQYMRLGTVSLSQTQDFYTQVYQFIIWFNEANKPDFKQWLSNEIGSPYENAGFAQMPYYTIAMKNDLMGIYNGNY
jgi:hypothetical protein